LSNGGAYYNNIVNQIIIDFGCFERASFLYSQENGKIFGLHLHLKRVAHEQNMWYAVNSHAKQASVADKQVTSHKNFK
jgi:hypothetical protein